MRGCKRMVRGDVLPSEMKTILILACAVLTASCATRHHAREDTLGESADEYWRRDEAAVYCGAYCLIYQFGAATAEPLLLNGMNQNTNANIRAGIVAAAARWHHNLEKDPDGRLFSVVEKGLSDPDAVVRKVAEQCRNRIDNKEAEQSSRPVPK